MISRSRSTRGFTLIEALVALLVMGFGMLGVLGIQSALRQYSDISKQRSEAVRMSQDAIEDWRAFVQLDTDPGADYADITSIAEATVTGTMASATNATYLMQRFVTPLTNTADLPQFGKWVQIDVRWKDRTDAWQTVMFHTHVTGVSPELAGTLLVPPAGGPGGPTRPPLGRHGGIPRQALDNGDGTSSFSPPGLPGTTWDFKNTSGEIFRICSPLCVDFLGYLLSGYVRFSDPPGPIAPDGANAENPTELSSTFGSIGVNFLQTAPGGAAAPVCVIATFPLYVAYYCAINVILADRRWAGQSEITGLALAAGAADATLTNARVCRYTPLPSHTAANVDHPLNYGATPTPGLVTESLFNQNFLVIRGGDGTLPFACPGDGPMPQINSNTFAHQPST